ncbi:alpha/beta hydrolase [Nonomuraea sediminis]|uniref:alpha/beta hydrolase n=1 Tax=Nonomuraea sediminis TaxID=2835864 RepID=UPI001BDCCF1E|nr:alpha/beta hydrolase [Nonomuraea sediminis]
MIIRLLLALALTVPAVPAETEARSCPVAVPANTTCGFLVVPERRDAPGRTTKVGYAVHRSTAKDRKPDPVVYMSGGPASASIQLTTFMSQMFPDRDVVTIEQRGSKYSDPVLSCPETAEAMLRGTDVGAAAATCRERLARQGVDLRGYNTKEIAADVVALRQALGYPQWNLFGVSYSTRVMLDVAAADPKGVRSVVLDSFLPERVNWYDDAEGNFRDVLTRLGVRDRFDAVVARLNAHPAQVPTVDPLVDKPYTARMTGDMVATILSEGMHDSDMSAVAPALIDALADGHDELLRPLADAVGQSLVSHEFGLYHAVQCQDEVPFNSVTARSRLFTVNGDRAVCAAWKLPRSAPVNATTTAPVLVVGGQDDPTTPARTAKPATEALPNGRFIEFANTSHAVFLVNQCARRRIALFVDSPDIAEGAKGVCDPATSAAFPRVTSADVHASGAPYQISLMPWLGAPFALFALVSLFQLVVGGLRGRALTAFSGLAGVAFTGLVAQSVYSMISENQTALAVGLPAAVTYYGYLAAASAVLAAVALLRERRWPQITAVVVAAGFLVWWYAWAM